MTATFERVKVDRITPHERNVRRDLGNLDELAASIKAQGLLQPLVVAPLKDGDGSTQHYVLVAGHRRHAAAAKAGVESLPCIVRDDLDTPAKVIEAMLVENLQRTDLTVMEEADAYAQLELLGVKEAAISKTTGRSRKTVHERLLLASLPTERREQYESGKLSLEGAVKCAKLRQQYAEDTEILALIDKAATYSFGSGYGIEYTISRLLEDRNRPDEPEDDDEDTIDYAGQRSEREAQWEKERQEREARRAALAASTERMYDWLSGRLAVQAQTVVDGLLNWALDSVVTDYGTDDWQAMVGVEPCGEDEDVDDANLRITTTLKQLPHQDKVIALVLAVSGAANRQPYWFDEHALSMAAIGYPLTDDDKSLMKSESQ